MENNKKSTEILNDLVKINNDRIAGYQKAIENLKDGDLDLRNTFTDMISESHKNKMALATEVSARGDEADNNTSLAGDIYRGWQDLKATFTGHDRKSILENCEFGEDAAQKAYKKALDNEHLTADLRPIISQQKDTLKISHDKIKMMRDSQP